MNRWLIAALVALVLSGSHLLDGSPSETDALQADSLNLSDAIADARSAKE